MDTAEDTKGETPTKGLKTEKRQLRKGETNKSDTYSEKDS